VCAYKNHTERGCFSIMLFRPSCFCVSVYTVKLLYIWLKDLCGGVVAPICLCVYVVYSGGGGNNPQERSYAPGLAIVCERIMYNTCCWSISVPNDVTTRVYKLVTVSLLSVCVYMYLKYDNNNIRVCIDSQIDLRRYRIFSTPRRRRI